MEITNVESAVETKGQPVLELDGLVHQLSDAERKDKFTIYVDRPFIVRAGNFTTILGRSGCGKTTLLTLLGLLRKPSSLNNIKRFRIYDDTEYDIAGLWQRKKERQIEQLRRRVFGFALQSGELLSSLTVSENIAVPLRLNGVPENVCRERVRELLDDFELGRDLINVRVNKLSGGQSRRVVLARAIAHSPKIIFVDEPTNGLNPELARKALKRLQDLQIEKRNTTAVVMITHDEKLSDEFSDQIVRMEPKGDFAGHIVEIISNNKKVKG